jgi:hypothetical protein
MGPPEFAEPYRSRLRSRPDARRLRPAPDPDADIDFLAAVVAAQNAARKEAEARADESDGAD